MALSKPDEATGPAFWPPSLVLSNAVNILIILLSTPC